MSPIKNIFVPLVNFKSTEDIAASAGGAESLLVPCSFSCCPCALRLSPYALHEEWSGLALHWINFVTQLEINSICL